MKPILLIIGTRPEGIKMAPVYFLLKKTGIPILLCSTTQHTHLLTEVYQTFNFKPDIELHVMQHNQDLFHITQEVLQKTKEVYQKINPQLVLVHGDTTTTMAAALSAFYQGIPVGHIEAGLRTESITNPFPEEMNRRFVSMIGTYHFAPTQEAVKNLKQDHIPEDKIFYTGNTVVDALRIMQKKIIEKEVCIDPMLELCIKKAEKNNQQIVLMTAHRRESFQGGIERILMTVKNFAAENPNILFIYPYHPNPNITQIIEALQLSNIHNIVLSKPLLYKDLVYTLLHAHWVATDSGGIQEEAISLGKNVIVFREYTERPEGVWQGLATIVGTDPDKIIPAFYSAKQRATFYPSLHQKNIYGDGYAADKIVAIIQRILFEKKEFDESHMHHGPRIHRSSNSNCSR